jgi:murein DD-endopeptidase MepM/ murein hydrolase activator NlpD
MKRIVSCLIWGLIAPGMIIMLGVPSPSAAQDGGNTSPVVGTTIHVVQRGETLFRIAMQYGTTVEAIADANGITDPRYITVGQRLLIPNANVAAPGTIITYTVKPGDTLETLTRIYSTTAESLAAANHITNPAQLFVGEELTISQGADSTSPSMAQTLYRAQPGENLARIALKFGVSLKALLDANNLTPQMPVFPGERLWIPGGSEPTVLTDLPLPFTSFGITPIPATQGKTISIHVTTTGPASLSGSFVGYPVQFVTQDVNQHYALFGIHTFTEGGVYPLAVTATDPNGSPTTFTLRVQIVDGGYGAEDISLDTQQQDLLNPQVTEPEWERVAALMSAFTAQRYFDGLMGLPSTGAITSQFGTRRAYNGGILDTFHSGTDFAGAPGSPVVAPAAGVVVLAEPLPVRGNATIIDHGWGVITGYWHQSEIYVKVGDVVAAGQVIGAVGSTGRSTGPHLHWEMWVGGVQVDPMQWVQESFP